MNLSQKKRKLFLEMNEDSFIFYIVDVQLNKKIYETQSPLIKSIENKNFFLEIDKTKTLVREKLIELEKKYNYSFNEVNIISNFTSSENIRISGFKNMQGSSISEEDVSFIISNIKKNIILNEKNKTILHIFNSNFFLDKKKVKKIPFNEKANFYGHELSFILIQNQDLKNVITICNHCDLKIKKIYEKKYLEAIKLIELNSMEPDLILLKLGKKKSQLILFENLSFNYYQSFNFGSNILAQDIIKICSLKIENVRKILKEIDFRKILKNKDEEFLHKKFFSGETYRKISLNYLFEILQARIFEIINIFFIKNSNLQNFSLTKFNTSIIFEDIEIKNNLFGIFKDRLREKKLLNIKTQDEQLELLEVALNLDNVGWSAEALPVVEKKKSFISRIFSKFFK